MSSNIFGPLLVLIGLVSLGQCHHSVWKYECHTISDLPQCVKVLAAESSTGMTLNKCKLTCGKNAVIWPKPVNDAELGNEVHYFQSEDIQHRLMCKGEVCDLLSQAVVIFKDNINLNYPNGHHSRNNNTQSKMSQVILTIEVTDTETHLFMNTDESYSFYSTAVEGQANIVLTAATFFGARNGLETLSQLINYDHEKDCLQIVDRIIITDDKPVFTYRGILLDTSRNFYPIKDIKRMIDGMAASKLNTFHWHLTDTASWPIEIPSLPKIIEYGAYAEDKVYTIDEIKDLVEYARLRGVRVIPEIDAPAHFGNGFQWDEEDGYGRLTVCTNREPWTSYCVEPPCGQVNLANPKIYEVFTEIYKAVIDAFSPIDIFHFGGDEVNLNCWNTTDEVVNWMLDNGHELTPEAYFEQWGVFQAEVMSRLTDIQGNKIPGILWTSSLTEANDNNQYFHPDDYVIQIWTTGTDPQIKDILKNGYNIIFSNYDDLYLDCGFGSWVSTGGSWCDPFKNWKTIYQNDPDKMAGEYVSQVHGGEATLWSETADHHSMDTRLWPRAAALGERLWSNPKTDWKAAEFRFIAHRQHLVKRGLGADRLQPEWCYQNEDMCGV